MNYFRIHFVRKNNTEPNRAWNDDVLTITPGTAVDKYDIEYRERQSRLKYTCTLLKSDLEEYIETILDNLSFDSDPFESIQILCPCLPSVLIPIEELLQNNLLRRLVHRNLIFFLQIQSTIEHEEYVPPVLRRRRRHATRDSDSESSASSTDSDASSETAEGAEEDEGQEGQEGQEQEDVDEDGFQRLPRESEEEPEPTHHDDADNAAHADGATEPTVQPQGAAAAGAPVAPVAPVAQLQGVPWGNSTAFPPTYPLFWTVWMPYR
jgi:hypothetical protein